MSSFKSYWIFFFTSLQLLAAHVDQQDQYGNTKLMWAAKNNQIETLKELLTLGANPNLKNTAQNSALQIAIKYGHIEIADILLSETASLIDLGNELFLELWFAALEQGRTSLVERLLNHGADIDAVNSSNQTALEIAFFSKKEDLINLLLSKTNPYIKWFSAIKYGKTHVVSKMLKEGMDPNTVNSEGVPSLCFLFHQHPASTTNIATLLLESGAHINQQDPHGNTALHLFMLHKNSSFDFRDNLQLLLDYNIDINIENKEGLSVFDFILKLNKKTIIFPSIESEIQTMLERLSSENLENLLKPFWFFCCRSGYCEAIRVLTQKNIDPNTVDAHGNTGLHIATLMSQDKIIPLLITYGTDIFKCNNDKKTPLDLAIECNHCSTMSLLVKSGAKLDLQKETPTLLKIFIMATNADDPSIAKDCLEQGLDPNTKLASGHTLLYGLIKSGKTKIIQLLMNRHARLDSSELLNPNLLHKALNKGNGYILEAILKNGINPNIKNDFGVTPLMGVVTSSSLNKNKIELMKRLIEYGADLNQKNDAKETVFSLASKNGYIDVQNFLNSLSTKPQPTLEQRLDRNIMAAQKHLSFHSNLNQVLFPEEIWAHIISYLDYPNIMNLIYVSKSLLNTCKKHANIKWFSFYDKRDFFWQFFDNQAPLPVQEEGPL